MWQQFEDRIEGIEDLPNEPLPASAAAKSVSAAEIQKRPDRDALQVHVHLDQDEDNDDDAAASKGEVERPEKKEVEPNLEEIATRIIHEVVDAVCESKPVPLHEESHLQKTQSMTVPPAIPTEKEEDVRSCGEISNDEDKDEAAGLLRGSKKAEQKNEDLPPPRAEKPAEKREEYHEVRLVEDTGGCEDRREEQPLVAGQTNLPEERQLTGQ